MVKSLLNDVSILSRSHMHTQGWQYHSLADLKLSVNVISFPSRTFAGNLPNITPAFVVLAVISSQMCTALESVLPKNNFYFCPFSTMIHCTTFQVLVGVQPLSVLC